MEKLSWCPTRGLTLLTHSWSCRVPCTLLEEKGNYQYLSAMIPATYDTYKLYWYNSGTNVTGVTNHFLTGFKAYSTRWKPSLTLLR